MAIPRDPLQMKAADVEAARDTEENMIKGEERPSHVAEEMDHLARSVDRLVETLDGLQGGLYKVLREVPPKPEEDKSELETSLAPLAYDIRVERLRVTEAIWTIQSSIMDRLEL